MHQGEGNEGMHPAFYRLVQKSTKEQSISIAPIDCGSEDGSSHHGSLDDGSEDSGSRQDDNQMKATETRNPKRIWSVKAMLSPRVQKKPKTIKTVGSTVYTTPVTCSARQYLSNVVDQTTSTGTVPS